MSAVAMTLTLSPRQLKEMPAYRADEMTKKRVNAFLSKWMRLVKPIAQVETAEGLQSLLHSRVEGYLRLMQEAIIILVESGENINADRLTSEGFGVVYSLIQCDKNVLTQNQKDDLLESIGIWQDTATALFKTMSINPSKVMHLLGETMPAFSRFNLTMAVVLHVISGELKSWNNVSIALLCDSISEDISEVEDCILSHDAILAERLSATGSTKSFDEVRVAIGIPA